MIAAPLLFATGAIVAAYLNRFKAGAQPEETGFANGGGVI
jgi:hypothetical protein